ncbi:hypothetical protein BTO30_01050 [Domibacillus antri]|uniref:Flagellin n=1 Tax=Domibacillus antri TaxID=1714264 RepID=A0A1Q8Q9L4_9BACI|nr:flagellin [Domibacillus antri]OLN24036.1 hypothetical protein BTO30_01050 [Domibacillus antri]
MIINHNIQALNTYRQFGAANAAQGKSMEKLSSGLRINRAGDDAAGLAISEKMRGQIRGLDQATRNAQDSISLIQTAEGALNETHSILQRMRELSVQSSNDTATDADRKELQKEISQLKEEIDRISNTTEFNTKKLLNGDLSAAKTAQGDILKSAALGGTQVLGSVAGDPSENAIYISGSQTFTVNDSGGATAATVTIASGVYTAAELAAALTSGLNSKAAYSGLDVTVSGGKFVFKDNGATGSGTVTISGTILGRLGVPTASTTVASGGTTAAANAYVNDAYNVNSGNNEFVISVNGTNQTVKLPSGTDYKDEAALVAALNTQLDANGQLSGITAAVSGTSIKFTIAATDKNVYEFKSAAGDTGLTLIGVASGADLANTTVLTNLADKDGDSLGVKAGDTISISFEINGTAGSATFKVSGASTDVQLLGAISGALKLASGSVSRDAAGNIVITGDAGESKDLQNVKLSIAGNNKFNNYMSNFSETQDAQDKTTNNSLSFHIGANQDQTMKVDISEMSVGSLSLSSVDISTQQGGENSITVINNALEKVSAERSKLGAFQNRLEHSINNLGTSAENLTAAESRIRDVDMAKEMMNQTKNSILSQAAQAMLAQANQAPQGVLQLLG